VNVKLRFIYPKDINFACTKCGLCCGDTAQKIRHILLLEADAQRIAAHTKQSILGFAGETAEKMPYVYEMHKNPNTGKCTFLVENQCTIYEQRPLICRFYPFELTTTDDGTYVFKETTECPSINKKETKNKNKENLDAAFFRELLTLACVELNRTAR
jgi:Fe-S-cluster containining protein